jgi:uncharacterized coiled-coil DUF342 family protein
LDELQLKREKENQEAERHRHRRDDLNDRTREWVDKRDSLNAQVRTLVEEATQHRIRRDELNGQVRAAKEERDVYNKKVNELFERVNDAKRKRLPRGAIPISKLRRDLRALEQRHMTSVLSPDKERALIEEMGRVNAELKKVEKAIEENEEVRRFAEELRAARDVAEAAHKRVSSLAEEAQKEHDLMSSLYERSDELRKEADLAQEEFIKTKMLADEEHRKHIDHIREVHDFDKIIHGLWTKQRAGASVAAQEAVVDAKKEAELIFERFKRGEKLSTEDLLTLQKTGYL